MVYLACEIKMKILFELLIVLNVLLALLVSVCEGIFNCVFFMRYPHFCPYYLIFLIEPILQTFTNYQVVC